MGISLQPKYRNFHLQINYWITFEGPPPQGIYQYSHTSNKAAARVADDSCLACSGPRCRHSVSCGKARTCTSDRPPAAPEPPMPGNAHVEGCPSLAVQRQVGAGCRGSGYMATWANQIETAFLAFVAFIIAIGHCYTNLWLTASGQFIFIKWNISLPFLGYLMLAGDCIYGGFHFPESQHKMLELRRFKYYIEDSFCDVLCIRRWTWRNASYQQLVWVRKRKVAWYVSIFS